MAPETRGRGVWNCHPRLELSVVLGLISADEQRARLEAQLLDGCDWVQLLDWVNAK